MTKLRDATFLLVALLVSCTPSTENATPSAASTNGPSVLLFLVDTLRADRVGTYGYDGPTTPTIDRLAREGIVFEDAYTPGPWTLPSVVSIMLSQPICRHGVEVDGFEVDAEATSLAQALHEVGYATASFIANTYAGRFAGLERGFDTNGALVDDAGSLIGSFLDEIGEDPFFIYVHDVHPHDPHLASPRALEPFGTVSPENLKRMKNRTSRYRQLTRSDFAAGKEPGTTDNTRDQRVALARLRQIKDAYGTAYDARVRQADEQIADAVDELARHGRLDDTVVIVVSDHGEELGEHGGWLHDQSVYEELVRAPLIVRLPDGSHAGTRIPSVVSLLDIAPTIADLTNTPVPPSSFEGRSLLPLLEAQPEERSDPAVVSMRINRKKYFRPWKTQRGDQNLVVREGPWKAIWNVEPNTVELYDLSVDPAEKIDLQMAHPTIATRLADHARDYLRRCQARRGKPQAHSAEISAESAERLRALGYID